VIQCPLPEVLPYSRIISEVMANYTLDEIIIFKCDYGFNEIATPMITCTETGTWSDGSLQCSSKYVMTTDSTITIELITKVMRMNDIRKYLSLHTNVFKSLNVILKPIC
jgi:hypothetical protein